MVEVQEGSLGSFKEDPSPLLALFVKEEGGVLDISFKLFSITGILLKVFRLSKTA